jgi:hypothetical protein
MQLGKEIRNPQSAIRKEEETKGKVMVSCLR